MTFTLPFSPFRFLARASVDKFDYEFDLWNGGGTAEQISLQGSDDNWEDNEIELTRSTQRLYFDLDGIPIGFAFKPHGSFDGDDDPCFGTLTDNGLFRFSECEYYGDYSGGASYFETLSIANRDDVSQFPVSLVNCYAIHSYTQWEEYLDGPFYEPFVVYFEQYNDIPSWVGYAKWNNEASKQYIFERTREYITEENNDYYEGVFRYDINGDGDIPQYVPAEYLLFKEDAGTINGITKSGTKANDKLKGKKKNDLLDGKKGNDILTGNSGNDLLYGKYGTDQLYGSDGDDFLNGGDNDDLLEGGSGADVFKLSAGNDTVSDFNHTEGDQIAIPIGYSSSFTITQSGDSVIIAADDYGQLELLDTKKKGVIENNTSIFLRYV